MPSQGKVERRRNIVDFCLNNRVHWTDLPAEVWEYRLGRHHTLKSWQSYRESKVLGRGMSVSEVTWWSEVARRVAGILDGEDN